MLLLSANVFSLDLFLILVPIISSVAQVDVRERNSQNCIIIWEITSGPSYDHPINYIRVVYIMASLA